MKMHPKLSKLSLFCLCIVLIRKRSGSTIFQDAFDSYTLGPLPTGTGANQWSSVSTTGTGFTVAVSNAQANSLPNSLMIHLGSGAKGHAWAMANYTPGTGYISHSATFRIYLDASLVLNQQIILFTTQNRAHPSNGSISIALSANNNLQVNQYDSLKHKHVTTTTSILSVGQWHTLQINQKNNATNGSWSLLLVDQQSWFWLTFDDADVIY